MTRSKGTILQIFASATWGGGEKFLCDLARQLADDGRRVVFVSRPSSVLRERTACFATTHEEMPLRGAADMVSAVRLARLILRERPSVIHLHNFKTAFTAIAAVRLARLFGCRTAPRIILTRHLVRKGKGGPFYSFIYRNISRIVFVSELARREFLSSRPPVDEAKTVVIHNAVPEVDPALTAPDLRAMFGIAADTPLLLFCGRLHPEKGIDVLLRACTLLGNRPFALAIVGTGTAEYTDALHRMVDEQGLGPRVFFFGFSDATPALMRQADIAAAPSVVAEAGGPFSTMEAMQAGVAAVSSNNGAQPEFTDHGTDGLLVPPSDASALAAALAQLLDDKDLRLRIGKAAARKFSGALSYESFYKKYLGIYGDADSQDPVNK